MARRASRLVPLVSCGASLVEVMVGVVVALVTVLAVYRVFVAAETLKRHAHSDGDAQQAALFVLARVAFDVGNAGAGLTRAANALATCPVIADLRAVTRPISVLITDGGAPDVPDTIVVRYATSNGMASAAPFAAAAPAGGAFQVRSPLGIASGDEVIAASGTGACVRTVVTGVRVASPGVVDVAHGIVAADMPDDAVLVNLGPAANVVATRFDISAGVLRTTDVNGGDAPNPLASNVVNLKAQYGIDSDGDGTLDTWIAANDAGAAGNWSPGAMLAAAPAVLGRIKALRIGVIVRGEQFDRSATGPFDWVLFDCPATDKTTCPGRLAGRIAGSTRGGWHYRVYETIVPLRNRIWPTS